MANINVDQWLDSVEKPTITLNGKTHTGRLLSYQQFLPIMKRLEGIRDSGDNEAYMSLATDYLNLVFPPSTFAFWKKPLASQILALPNIQEVLTHFLVQQTASMGLSKK